MIRLRVGYVIVGIITGLLLVLSFFATIPDGKLHITFCNVGQGDGIYIRFPNGRDMVIDSGPGNKIITCLSRHMPFWDRTIDMALLTHPQKDHLGGLLSVLERYQVQFFVRSDVDNPTDEFEKLKSMVKHKHITEKFVTRDERITVGSTTLSILWPSKEQIALMKPMNNVTIQQCSNSLQTPCPTVLGTTSDANVNDGSLVFSLSYGMFDSLFSGDADSHVQPRMVSSPGRSFLDFLGSDRTLEIFKVPHHGSKTGLTSNFLDLIAPNDKVKTECSNNKVPCPLAVISVGNNSYGHPAPEIIQKLESAGFETLRTDKEGDIEVISDGIEWEMKKGQ